MDQDDKDLLQKLEQRRGAMVKERSSWISHWQEIAQFLSPRTSRFLATDRNKGEKVNQDIINETALFARRTLESGLMAGMSAPSRPWFLLSPPDPEMKDYGPVRDWIDAVTRTMREVFIRSNLYGVLPKTYGACGDYGTAAFGLQEDDADYFRCYPFPVGSFMIDCDDRMVVNTLYREFSMTVRQMVGKFGKKACSRSVQAQWDRGDYGEWVTVVHAIEPNDRAIEGKLTSRDKPFMSAYYEKGGNSDTPLRVSGFEEFPALAPRWYVLGEDVYGVNCPGMYALGSVKALQLEEKRKYQAIDYHVRPPQNADAALRNSGAALLPGGVNWISGMTQGRPGVTPVYQTNPAAVQVLSEDIAGVENRIRRAYYEDLMLMLAQSDNPQMTAREVEERHQEKLLVLGPLMEQLNDDLFDPLIDRTFNILYRRGKFPPPPPELEGQPLRVEYVSIMAQAQKLIGVSGVERFVGFVGNMAAISPTAMDKLDVDQTIDEYGDMVGVPSKIIVSDDQVAAVRQRRAQQQQMQQLAAAAPSMQQGAQAAKALSETNVKDVNALTQLMTGFGNGGAA